MVNYARLRSLEIALAVFSRVEKTFADKMKFERTHSGTRFYMVLGEGMISIDATPTQIVGHYWKDPDHWYSRDWPASCYDEAAQWVSVTIAVNTLQSMSEQ